MAYTYKDISGTAEGHNQWQSICLRSGQGKDNIVREATMLAW